MLQRTATYGKASLKRGFSTGTAHIKLDQPGHAPVKAHPTERFMVETDLS
jgi:hypothetical protein